MDTREANLGNRLKLLEAGAEIFSTTGYNGASLRAIAKRANVSFQLIQHHFGTKHELWLAVVEYLYAALVLPDEMLAFDTEADLQAQLREHLFRMMVSALEHAALHKIMCIEQLENSERYTEHLKPRFMDFLDSRVRPYFEQVESLGILQGWTANEAAAVWVSLTNLNIIDPDCIERFLEDAPGTMKSIHRQVHFIARIFTGGLSVTSDALAERSQQRAIEHNVIYPSDFQHEQPEDDLLRLENKRLKQLVGELALENRLLIEQTKERAPVRKHRSDDKN